MYKPQTGPTVEPRFTGPKPNSPGSNGVVEQQRLQAQTRRPFHPNAIKGPPGEASITSGSPDAGRALLRQAMLAVALRQQMQK